MSGTAAQFQAFYAHNKKPKAKEVSKFSRPSFFSDDLDRDSSFTQDSSVMESDQLTRNDGLVSVSPKDLDWLRNQIEKRYEVVVDVSFKSTLLVLIMKGQVEILISACEGIKRNMNIAEETSNDISKRADELEIIATRIEENLQKVVQSVSSASAEMHKMTKQRFGIIQKLILWVVWLIGLIPQLFRRKQ